MLGWADLARERMAQMLEVADKNNSYDRAFSAYFPAGLMNSIRDYEHADALAVEALKLSEEHTFPDIAGLSRCLLGNIRAQLGRTKEGIGLIRQGIGELLQVGARLGTTTMYPTYLAAALELEGNIGEGLQSAELALQANREILFYRPETLRIRGKLRLKQGRAELAEADFREAIALAKNMSAKSWELRATMSLARLLASQGKQDEARAMLAQIYNWFTEGFDTADLIDAKTLLDELGN